MSKKNYTNYSKPKQVEVEPAVEETKEDDSRGLRAQAAVVDECVPNEVKEEVVKTVTGMVINCGKLRVRESASPTSNIICEITAGTEVTIDEVNSSNEFYKVCTAAGIEGFCMKDFIDVIQ